MSDEESSIDSFESLGNDNYYRNLEVDYPKLKAALEFYSKWDMGMTGIQSNVGVLGKLVKFFQKYIYAPVIHDPLTFLGMPKSWRGSIFNW